MPKRNLVLVAAILAAAAVLVVVNHKPTAPVTGGDDQAQAQALAQACRVIKENYYRSVDEGELCCGLIDGMVGRLDKWSSYIPPNMLQRFNNRMNGRYFGLGLKVEIIDGAVVVIGPLISSPAHRADIRTGDHIISVNAQPLAGLTLEEVQNLLEGNAKEVTLVIQRGQTLKTLTLARENLPIETVVGLCRQRTGQWSYMLDERKGIAYVRLKEFVPQTCDDLERVIRQMGLPRSIVLDLRDNPGGALASAVGAANLFLKNGRIVSSMDRTGRPEVYDAHPDRTYSDTIPLVVLVNGHTASAAEIVAGALWANDRAVLVGIRTLGKGCVQKMFPMGKGLGQINLTTAVYYLKDDIPISPSADGSTWGIEPHVKTLPLHEQELASLRARAEVLFQPTPETMPASWPAQDESMAQMMRKLDTQLAQACRLLEDPQEMRTVLKQAAQDRARRKALATQASERVDD